MDKPVREFSPEALDAMAGYPWPGNVRELHNAVERALLSCRGNRIELADLPKRIHGSMPVVEGPAGAGPGNEGLDNWLEERERRAIMAALEASQGVQAQAARRLRITERSLWHRIKKLGIHVERMARDPDGS
jgi:DNA-binding NtrC family response regulator